ncbi:MAG: PPC domain-containing DNA-binding protein [Halobacteriaceae archaeon]
MEYRELSRSEDYLLRLTNGAEWREEIETFATEQNISAGWFMGMGAVQDAEIWFYDQTALEYRSVNFDEPLEVASCVGNIALLDEVVFAHTHAVLSRESGQSIAGHLNKGTVFAGEVYLVAFDTPLERTHDQQTDLDLWL